MGVHRKETYTVSYDVAGLKHFDILNLSHKFKIKVRYCKHPSFITKDTERIQSVSCVTILPNNLNF